MRVLIIFLIQLITVTSFASQPSGAVSLATGQAAIASVDAGDSVFLNPAAMAHLKGYFITTGLIGQTQANTDSSNLITISVGDNSVDAMVPAGVLYTHGSISAAGTQWKSRSAQVAMGDFVAPKVAVGLSVFHQILQSYDVVKTRTSADLGLLHTPTENLGLGFLAKNLGITKDQAAWPLERLSPQLGLGFNYIYQSFIRVRLDLMQGPAGQRNKLSSMMGFESFLSQWLIFRIGAQRDGATDSNLSTFGLGFAGPKFQINYAYQTKPQDLDYELHAVDLVIPF
jgi:hypothetical protein